VSVIANTVAIEVGPFVGIKREQILRIGHTVTINVRTGLLRSVALRLVIPVADAITIDIIIKNIRDAVAVLIGRARIFILPVVTQLHFRVIGDAVTIGIGQLRQRRRQQQNAAKAGAD